MKCSIVFNRGAQKGPWSRWVEPPEYHTITQKSILVH